MEMMQGQKTCLRPFAFERGSTGFDCMRPFKIPSPWPFNHLNFDGIAGLACEF